MPTLRIGGLNGLSALVAAAHKNDCVQSADGSRQRIGFALQVGQRVHRAALPIGASGFAGIVPEVREQLRVRNFDVLTS
jgi:hypothetical protein